MNTKRIGTGIAALLALVVLTAGSLTLASCFNPLAKEETQGRFVIGGSSARAYFDKTSDTDIAQLTLDITVSDGPGPEQHKTGTGLGGVAFTVAPGTWTITVRAYFNNNFAAYGTTTMNISAGDNNVVVDMHTFEAGLYQIDGGTYTRVDDVAHDNVDAAVGYINGQPGTYMLFVEPTAPISTAPQTLGADEHLTLVGITPTTIQLSSTGTLFIVQDGASLTLDSGITLNGRNPNTSPLVQVGANSAFTMRGGTISGNTTSSNGGGVYVDADGTFTMRGGTIIGNTTSSNGGGVYVEAGGTFTKTGGTISGNTATNQGRAVYVNSTPPKYRDTDAGDTTASAGFWEGPTYTVTFNANGGTGDTTSRNVVAGNSITLPEVTKPGNTFDGWYENAGFTGTAVTSPYIPTGTITLHAKWVAVTYNVGDTGPGGGIVFYHDPDGFPMADGGICHYLEAATSDLTTTTTLLAWTGYYATPYANVTDAVDDAIGAGRKNTQAILNVSTGDPSSPAALACDGYNGGGKTDWFLPSREELKALHAEKTRFTGWVTSGDGREYWSSTQVAGTGMSNQAWSRDFIPSDMEYRSGKSAQKSVRPIRAF